MHNPVLAPFAAGDYGDPPPSDSTHATSEDALAAVVLHWHKICLDAALQDFSTLNPDGSMASAEQPVATYQSRAMAIAHVALHDAYVAVTGDDDPYSELCDVPEFDCARPPCSARPASACGRCHPCAVLPRSASYAARPCHGACRL